MGGATLSSDRGVSDSEPADTIPAPLQGRMFGAVLCVRAILWSFFRGCKETTSATSGGPSGGMGKR